MASLIMLISLTTMAQVNLKGKTERADNSREGGGGSSEEVQKVFLEILVKEKIFKIKNFFQQNSLATKDFPEIEFTKFYELIDQVDIEIVDNDIRDRFNISRTAVNYADEKKIIFNQAKLESIKSAGDILLILSFHELLGLMKLEENDPHRKDLAMNYAISGRLVKYLVQKRAYDLEFRYREPVNYDSCKVYVGIKKFRKDKAALELLEDKGYALVNSEKKSDFVIYYNQNLGGYQKLISRDGEIIAMISIEHRKTGFVSTLGTENKPSYKVVHSYNREIAAKIQSAPDVNTLAKLQSQLRPELDYYTTYISENEDFSKQVPSCKEMLGEKEKK